MDLRDTLCLLLVRSSVLWVLLLESKLSEMTANHIVAAASRLKKIKFRDEIWEFREFQV